MSSILKISQNAVKTSTNQIFRKTMEKFQLEYYKKIAIITKGNGFNENTTNGNNNRTFILLGTVDTILSSPIFEGLRRKSKNPYNLRALKSLSGVGWVLHIIHNGMTTASYVKEVDFTLTIYTRSK